MDYVTQTQLLQLFPKFLLLMMLSGFMGAVFFHVLVSGLSRVVAFLADRWSRGGRVRIARFRAIAQAKLRGHG